MDQEDGLIWVYGPGDESVLAFTDFGIETLTGLVEIFKADPDLLKVFLRGRPPFLSGQDRRRLDFDRRRGDEKCPQVWLWAQVWESGGVTGPGLRL